MNVLYRRLNGFFGRINERFLRLIGSILPVNGSVRPLLLGMLLSQPRHCGFV
jgi:hypothetical protein